MHRVPKQLRRGEGVRGFPKTGEETWESMCVGRKALIKSGKKEHYVEQQFFGLW